MQPDFLSEEEASELAAQFKALSDPTRLRLYSFIAAAEEPVCACHMPEALGISQPTLSHHIKKLLSAGLISKEMRGKWAFFASRRHTVADLQRFLAG